MIVLDFVVNVTPLISLIERAERRLDENIDRFLKESGETAEQSVKSLMPVFSSEAKDSITHEFLGGGDDKAVRIYSDLDDQMKIMTIEKSRRQGAAAPPAAVLLPWVQKKWGGDLFDAIRLAQHIKQEGSHNPPEGERPFGKTAEHYLPIFATDAERIIDIF